MILRLILEHGMLECIAAHMHNSCKGNSCNGHSMSQDGIADAVPCNLYAVKYSMYAVKPSEHVTLLTCTVHASVHSIKHMMSHHGSLITSHVTDMHKKGCQMPLTQMQHRTPLICNCLADMQKSDQS